MIFVPLEPLCIIAHYSVIFVFVVPGEQVDGSFELPTIGGRTENITMKQMPWMVSLGGYVGK